MHVCESINEAEHWGIDAFKLWWWRRLLRVPWTARRSNQSILKEINPDYSLEGLMLKLKLWPPDVNSQLTGKDPDAGKDWGQEDKRVMMVGWHHQLKGHEFEQTSGDSEEQGRRAAVHGVAKSQTQLSHWTLWHRKWWALFSDLHCVVCPISVCQ